ncbi:hypothetical protein E2C01_090107 [Portunus trituberculatus]|uniref:Uncharacterized protein n=1 Tax=Portunus trituberculatus TaxID=210409 RepID=A0A5B7JL03_PORTR|nr:hypothetical protein [Portunus trituberculatus]
MSPSVTCFVGLRGTASPHNRLASFMTGINI